MDLIILKSVGSYIRNDGQVGPLAENGLPDLQEDTISISDTTDEWRRKMSPEDNEACLEIWLDVILPDIDEHKALS